MSRFSRKETEIEPEAAPLLINAADLDSRVASSHSASSSTASMTTTTSKKVVGLTGLASMMVLFAVAGFKSGNDGFDVIHKAESSASKSTSKQQRENGRIATTTSGGRANKQSLGEIPLTAQSYDAIRDMVMKDEEKSKSKKRGSTSSSSSLSAYASDPLLTLLSKDGADAKSFPSLVPQFVENDFAFADGSWKHRPAKEHNGKFTMCLAGGKDSWDGTYTGNLNTLYEPGLCIGEVREELSADCDVRLFNQGAFLWTADYKTEHAEGEDPHFLPPKKDHSKQVDFYYAHESADHYGYELKDPKSLKNMQYIAAFHPTKTGLWYPFGPSISALLTDYELWKLPKEARVPAIAWWAKDCAEDRSAILKHIATRFPVMSMGGCEHNMDALNDPGRNGNHMEQDLIKSQFMFYFALENGVQCPNYMTEKLWDSLTRGSIPIYVGWDGIEDYIPSKESVIDLRDFNSVDELAAKLEQYTTDEKLYQKAHEWRTKNPKTWPEGFRNLVRHVSSDLKAGMCNTLRQGLPGKGHAKDQESETCDHNPTVLGEPAQRITNNYRQAAIKSWQEFLSRDCNEDECAWYKLSALAAANR